MIETAHLRLFPYAPEHLLALLVGPEQFEERIGLPAAPGLRDFLVTRDVSPAWVDQLRATPAADPWIHGFAVVHTESREVIGNAAFKGLPDKDGIVEIAYGIVPGYQGRGYATEAAAALVYFALASDQVRQVRAHTLPTPNASTHVLRKCGFTFIGEVVDPEDGLIWRWERTREPA